MLGAIAGYDPLDPASIDVPIPDYSRAFKVQKSGLRLGIPRSPFFEGLDAEVAAAVEMAIGVLRKLTRSAADVQLPQPADVVTIMRVEAYAYHSKWIAESPEKYQPLTRQRLLGSADLNAAGYAEALRQMNLQRREITKVFSTIDLLVTPTMMRTAESFAESKNFDPLGTRNTSPSTLLDYLRSGCRADFPQQDCRSVFKSAALHSRNPRYWCWRMPMSAIQHGTRGGQT